MCLTLASDLGGLEPGVLEGEVRLDALGPLGVVVEEDVGAAFELWGREPRLFVTLEPGEILGMIPREFGKLSDIWVFANTGDERKPFRPFSAPSLWSFKVATAPRTKQGSPYFPLKHRHL